MGANTVWLVVMVTLLASHLTTLVAVEAPKDVKLTPLNTTHLRLSWSNQGHQASDTRFWSNSEPNDRVLRYDVTSTYAGVSYTVGVQDDDPYVLDVVGHMAGVMQEVTIKSVGQNGHSKVIYSYASLYPLPVDHLDITTITASGFTVQWSMNWDSGEDNYILVIEGEDFYLNDTIQSSDKISYHVDAPTSGASYNVFLWTESNHLHSESYAFVSVRTAPLPPMSIECYALSESAIVITLNPPNGSTEVEYWCMSALQGEKRTQQKEFTGATEGMDFNVYGLSPGRYLFAGYTVSGGIQSEAVIANCALG